MTVRGLALTTSVLGFIFLQRIGANLFNRALENGKDLDSRRFFERIWCTPCRCGFPNVKARIVGGWETHVNEYPWVVALYNRGWFSCGGTIINDLYILTAAHCLRDMDVSQLMVVVAEHNRSSLTESTVEVHRVAKLIVHEQFNMVNLNDDIGLLKLDRRLQFRREVSPLCLPIPDEQFSGVMARVMGWGHTTEGGNLSMVLMETYLVVLSNTECHRYPGYDPAYVTDNTMCAGIMSGGHGPCQGDSGGSLVVEDWTGRMYQAGIVSWGIGCARPNKPAVFTRVSAYLEWIIKHTKDACYCTS